MSINDVLGLRGTSEGADMEPVRNISNSEVTCFLSCRRMYYFAFGLELQPKEMSKALNRGNLFHYACETYWKARMEGYTHKACFDHAMDSVFNNAETTKGIPLDHVMETSFLWKRCYEYNAELFASWTPLGVEVQQDLAMTPNLNLTIKYDLYYQDPNGKKFILDWKTAYDFWTVKAHDANGQMPKYIGTMRANGFEVDGGQLFEIRTRKLGKEKSADPNNLWRMTPYYPSHAKIQTVMKQHIMASQEIEVFRRSSPENQLDRAVPVLSKYGACSLCSFTDLCNAVNEGKQDLSVDIRVGYDRNDYRYNAASIDAFEF